MRHPDREREGGVVVLVLLAGLVVLLGGAYAAAYLVAGDNVPRGTTVAGVPIGGHSPAVARELLAEQLGPRATAPLTLVVDGREVTVEPVEAGLDVDYGATVDAAGGARSWAPERLWAYFTGGEDVAPVVRIDDEALHAALVDLTEQVGSPARDGDLVFDAGGVRSVPPSAGRAVDPTTATAAIEAAYLADDGTPPPEITTVPTRPDIDEADVQRALDTFGNPAMSGPVTLVVDRASVRLSPQQFGPALDVAAEDGRLVPQVDEDRLMRLVEQAVSRRTDPVDASFRIADGAPVVVPARPGVRFGPAAVADAFLAAARGEGDERRRAVATRSEPAALTTRDARGLGVTERVATSTSRYPRSDAIDAGVIEAAGLLDGTLLEPGESLSFDAVVGDVLDSDAASQVASTLFDAAYLAGLEDVERVAHPTWLARFPEGRDAAVGPGVGDLRLRNDTRHGVFVTAAVTPSARSRPGEVYVSVWSTRAWDVDVQTSPRHDVRPPATTVLHGPACTPSPGTPGFTVDVTRTVRRAGESAVDHTDVLTTSYAPVDRVVCR
ncbi:VanW family protein [Nocardioides taihuensis]|uniref:VanW family protein n=1 Tax=Nocardioides taihuensis TaxID=1835606 RepID=A0ABW0BJP3_9ACTN